MVLILMIASHHEPDLEVCFNVHTVTSPLFKTFLCNHILNSLDGDLTVIKSLITIIS